MSSLSPERACGPTEVQCVDSVSGRATEVSVHDSSYNRDLGTYCQNLRSNFYYKLGLTVMTVMNLDSTQPILGAGDT